MEEGRSSTAELEGLHWSLMSQKPQHQVCKSSSVVNTDSMAVVSFFQGSRKISAALTQSTCFFQSGTESQAMFMAHAFAHGWKRALLLLAHFSSRISGDSHEHVKNRLFLNWSLLSSWAMGPALLLGDPGEILLYDTPSGRMIADLILSIAGCGLQFSPVLVKYQMRYSRNDNVTVQEAQLKQSHFGLPLTGRLEREY